VDTERPLFCFTREDLPASVQTRHPPLLSLCTSSGGNLAIAPLQCRPDVRHLSPPVMITQPEVVHVRPNPPTSYPQTKSNLFPYHVPAIRTSHQVIRRNAEEILARGGSFIVKNSTEPNKAVKSAGVKQRARFCTYAYLYLHSERSKGGH
jgi:hypothetical protein